MLSATVLSTLTFCIEKLIYGNVEQSDEFEKQVQKVHGDDKHGRVYALAIAMAREQIELDDEDVEEEDE